MSGGKCPGGTCPGGFCPVTIMNIYVEYVSYNLAVKNAECKGHDTSTNLTQLLSRVGRSWCMCHRLTTRLFPSFQSNSRPFGRV